MNVKSYCRASALDFVLCVIIAVGLGFINCGAFFVSEGLQYNWAALIIAVAIPLAVLFATAYSKRTLIPGIAATLVLFVVAMVVANAAGSGVSILKDDVGNPAMFVAVMFISALLTFLLSRRRWMSRALVLIAIVDMCFVEFMYKDGHWVALVITLIAVGAMAVYRNYRTNLMDASSPQVSFTSAFAVGAVYSILLAAVACLLFFLVIAPLHPGANEFKPFTKYYNYENVEMTGVGDSSKAKDPNNASGKTDDQNLKTNQENNEEDKGQSEKDKGASMNPLQSLAQGSLEELGDRGSKRLREMVNYLIDHPATAFLLLLLIVVIIALPFVIKLRLRKRWFARTCDLPPQQAAQDLFLFFMRGFALLKIKKREDQTLAEFAQASKGQLLPFAINEGHVQFESLAETYSKVKYADAEPTQEELEEFKTFYKGFHKAFKGLSGKVKYAFRFWRV